MKIPTALIVCATIVLCVAILAVAGLLASGASSESVAVLTGLIATILVNVLGLVRTQQIKGTVDDLANGKMDAKIRANVGDVVADHLIDPAVKDQLAVDRARRDGHA